jgi:hypothetical protein
MEPNNTRQGSLQSRSGLAVWRPRIVTPPPVSRVSPRVVLAEPGLRPEAIRAQMDAARTALATLAGTRDVLRARADAAEARAVTATTERERVEAMFDAYRVKTALDEMLRTTLRQVSGLMEERGL